MRVRVRTIHMVVVLTLVLGLVWPLPVTFAQVGQGATMTVLKGQVAVVHEDGSAEQPAPSGTLVKAGDEIRTLSPGGALITFFSGIEIELGDATVILVGEVAQNGARVNVSISQVFGTTVSRIESFADPLSAYRIENGGAVAVIRGSTLAMRGPEDTPNGTFAAAVCIDCGPEDYLEEVDQDEEQVDDDQENAVAPARDPAGLARAELRTSSDGRVAASGQVFRSAEVDTSTVFEDTFWRAFGLDQAGEPEATRAQADGAEAKLLAGDTEIARAAAPAADGSVVRISGRERVALGNVTHKSAYGFVWQAQKVIGRGAGARVLVRVLDPKTHQSVRLKIRLRDWRKITKFLAVKVDRLLDAATQAADLITAGAQDEQGGKSPGSSNPGTGAKKEQDEDDTANGSPSTGGVGAAPGGGVRATVTTVNCSGSGTFFCIAQVRAVDGQAPPPTGDVHFASTSLTGTFPPPNNGVCTLTPFTPPQNRASCSLFYTGFSPATITADYHPNPGFGASNGTTTVP